MLSMIRRALIRILLPLSWARSRDRVAKSLLRFSHTEADSAWQFLRAAEILESQEHRTTMIANALEELEHAGLFYEAARKYAKQPLPLGTFERKALVSQEADLINFLAYTYIGEQQIHIEFETYSKVTQKAYVGDVFQSIREDEAGHEDSAYKLLVALQPSRRLLRLALLRARLRRAYRDWMRFSETLGDALSWFWLSLIYYCLAPWVVRSCRQRLIKGNAVLESPTASATMPVRVQEQKLYPDG